MNLATFCSGIGAPECAWVPLGFRPQFVSEIEPFPCAVLARHHPDVPNLGDMTKITDEQISRFSVDVVCAGTPCQSFSVAGLRKGMADPRGNLALVFLRLVNRILPRWLVWENVPGVLSSAGGRDFGTFLGGLAELGYGWSYRILDAQYAGVPQRRRRVFVVGCLGDWRRAAAVLFERHSLSGNPPPSRETRSRVAGCLKGGTGISGTANGAEDADRLVVSGTLPSRSSAGGGLGTDFDCDGGLIAHSLRSKDNLAHRADVDTLIPQMVRSDVAHSLRADGFDASEDGTGRGTPLVPIAFNHQSGGDFRPNPSEGLANGLSRCQGQAIAFDTTQITSKVNRSNPRAGDPCHTLAKGADAPAIAMPRGVRRITPLECERLMGFHDGYTAIQFRGKPAADQPRYRALGNSMAVPVLTWIGQRILEVEEIK